MARQGRPQKGLGGSVGIQEGPSAVQAFPKVPGTSGRTTREQAVGVGSLDLRGTPSCLLLARKERPQASQPPAQHPVSLTSMGEPALPTRPPNHSRQTLGVWCRFGGRQGRKSLHRGNPGDPGPGPNTDGLGTRPPPTLWAGVSTSLKLEGSQQGREEKLSETQT